MENEATAYEIICGELDKIAALVADEPLLQMRLAPHLAEIRAAAQTALPCPVMPAISMKDYTEQLPEPAELMELVNAAGAHCEFHGYTFWRIDQAGWSLTNPYGIDDVMILRELADFDRFLEQLRAGVVIG